jgi:hypothetical protein
MDLRDGYSDGLFLEEAVLAQLPMDEVLTLLGALGA